MARQRAAAESSGTLLSAQTFILLASLFAAVAFGVVGIVQTRAAQQADRDTRRAEELSSRQSFMLNQQAELIDQLEVYADDISFARGRGQSVGRYIEVLNDAKRWQRRTRGALYAGDYEEAGGLLELALALLYSECPEMSLVCIEYGP
jgi:hypothetical protein